jgi:hypothetical protein
MEKKKNSRLPGWFTAAEGQRLTVRTYRKAETIKRQNRVCRDYCLPKKTMIESYKQKDEKTHSVDRCTCAASSDVYRRKKWLIW